MKNKILPIFIIFAVPILYFYNESVAVLLTSLVVSGFTIFSLWEQQKIKILPSKVLFVFCVLIGVWLFTVGRSVWLSCSIYGSISAFIKICVLLLLSYSVCYQLASDSSSKMSFYRIAAITGFLQGLMAIIEYIEAPPIPSTWLDPASKELFRTRCCGIMTDPNIFAAFLSALFIMTVALIIRSENKKEKVVAATSLILCGTGIMMTLSRGGWIALFAALVALAISLFIAKIKPDKTTIKILTCSVVILLIIFFSGPFKYRLFSITKPSDMTFFQRTLINKGILGSINKLPIYGHGLHSFLLVYPLYRIVGGDYPMYAHNEYLQSMIETGFFSSILLAVITIYLLRFSYIAAKNKKTDSMIFSAVFISFLIQNLSGFSSRIFPTALLMALSVGGITSCQLKTTKESIKKFALISNNTIKYAVIALIILVIPGCLNLFHTQSLFEKANSCLSSQNLLEAIKTYDSILQKEPNNPSAANTLGMIFMLAKQKDKAEIIWKNAANANKYEAIFPINLARLYTETDENQAIHYYSKALEIDPASELFRLEFAKYLIKQGKKQEAKEIITKGLTYSPGFHNVYVGFKEMEELLTKL